MGKLIGKNKIIFAMMVVIFASVSIVYLIGLQHMLEKELQTMASVVAVISIIVAIPTYLLKKSKEDGDETDRVSRNLCGELAEGLDGISAEKYPEQAVVVKLPDGSKVSYMNRHLYHDVYDSLVYSGKINLFPSKTLQDVQSIFTSIKNHNYYLKYAREIKDAAKDNYVHKAMKYYKDMEAIEKGLAKAIPAMVKKLEKDYDIPSVI